MRKAYIMCSNFSGKLFPPISSLHRAQVNQDKISYYWLVPVERLFCTHLLHFECSSRISDLCRSLSFGSFFGVVTTQSTRNRKPEITPHSTPSPHSKATQHELTKVLVSSSIFISRTWRFSCFSYKLRNSFTRIVSSISSSFSGYLQQRHLLISDGHLAKRESGVSNPFAPLTP